MHDFAVLNIGMGYKIILKRFHPNALEVYNSCCDLVSGITLIICIIWFSNSSLQLSFLVFGPVYLYPVCKFVVDGSKFELLNSIKVFQAIRPQLSGRQKHSSILATTHLFFLNVLYLDKVYITFFLFSIFQYS